MTRELMISLRESLPSSVGSDSHRENSVKSKRTKVGNKKRELPEVCAGNLFCYDLELWACWAPASRKPLQFSTRVPSAE